MRHADRTAIRALPLLQDVSETHFEELVNAAFLQRFPQGVTLIVEGELPDFLHIVVDGTVELSGSHDGRETMIEIMEPGTTFILAAVIRNKPYLKLARTLEPARILMIPAPAVRNVLGQDAAFACAIVDELAERYRGVVRALKNERLRTGAQRLANWILHTNARQGRRHQIELKFNKGVLASRLGMTRENLSRNFALLTHYGVKSPRRWIIIENLKALERFAKPDALIDGQS